jgi:hypothetical protein
MRGGGGEKSCLQKCRSEGSSFLLLLEEFLQRFNKDKVELLVVMARQIWLRRNSLVFEGVFRHPDEVYAEAVEALEEFKRCNSQDLQSTLSGE